MKARFYHPSKRWALLVYDGEEMHLGLYGWDACWEDWQRLVRSVIVPDTPHARRHLRTLAIDWCAHGVSPCEATTRSGLPKRGMDLGVVESDPGWVPFIRSRLDNMSPTWWAKNRVEFLLAARLHDERAAVREVTRG